MFSLVVVGVGVCALCVSVCGVGVVATIIINVVVLGSGGSLCCWDVV